MSMDTDKTRSILSRGRADGASEAVRLRRMKVEQQIADATMALLAEGRAFADLSVGEIATRAGIARSAFYNHYADKRELIIRLAERHSKRVAEHMAAFPIGDLIAPKEQVTAMLRVTASAYTSEPDLARALFEAASSRRRTLLVGPARRRDSRGRAQPARVRAASWPATGDRRRSRRVRDPLDDPRNVQSGARAAPAP